MPETLFDVTQALSRMHAFLGLEPHQLEQIAPLVEIRRYSVGDQVVSLDNRECDLYMILEGELRVLDAEGRRLADVGAGASIGEVALLDQQPRSASVVAISEAAVGVVPALELWLLMERRPDLGKTVLFNIGRVLAGRLRSANSPRY